MAHVDECYVIRIPYAFGTIEPGTTKYNGIETKKNCIAYNDRCLLTQQLTKTTSIITTYFIMAEYVGLQIISK